MRLRVKGFSCLQDVDVEFQDVTILIGEQGSGKSVLYKLAYYFVDKVAEIPFEILNKNSKFQIKDFLIKDFKTWFPFSAWGEGDFAIEFQLGKMLIKLLRQQDSIEVEVSDNLLELIQFINDVAEGVSKSSASNGLATGENPQTQVIHVLRALELVFDKTIYERFSGKDISTQQVYIPAGRSLFTSLSKAVSVLTKNESLDEVTRAFARVYMSSLDRIKQHGVQANDQEIFKDIFKGSIATNGDTEFIEMIDGRNIPLNVLSSGQQEAFPLMAFLCTRDEQHDTGMMYLEEPEAHLFPEAQGKLLKVLLAARNNKQGFNQIFISTHSPYILSQLNNLLLAGQIHINYPFLNKKLKEIVRPDCWLDGRNVAAYELRDGKSTSIIDRETGLIDGEYLDGFSSILEDEFFQLMELERNAN